MNGVSKIQEGEPSSIPGDRRHATSFIVFAVVLLGAPAYELTHGEWPGHGVEIKGAEYVIEGELAKGIDLRLQQRGALVTLIRPWIATSLLSWFDVHHKKVVLGRDGWLFLASTVKNYPRRTRAQAVPDAANIGRFVEALRHLGIETIIVPIPNKATMNPERLPEGTVQPAGLYEAMVTALRKAGVQVVDLLPVARELGQEYYLRADTHWTWDGAWASAEATAALVRRHFGEAGVPGEPFVGTADVRQIEWRGDLVRLLGLRPGSIEERGYLNLIRKRFVPPEELTRGLIFQVTVVGTSYSHSFDFAHMLGSILGRRVGSISRGGSSSTQPLVELVARIFQVGDVGPQLLVWEFPEHHFYSWSHEYQRRCAREVPALVAQWNRYRPLMNPTPVSTEVRTVRRKGLEGTPTSNDPSLLYTLRAHVPGDGSFELRYSLSVDHPGTTKVLFDDGQGFREQLSAIKPIKRGLQEIAFVVQVPGGVPVKRIRIDPVNSAHPFRILKVRLARR